MNGCLAIILAVMPVAVMQLAVIKLAVMLLAEIELAVIEWNPQVTVAGDQIDAHSRSIDRL